MSYSLHYKPFQSFSSVYGNFALYTSQPFPAPGQFWEACNNDIGRAYVEVIRLVEIDTRSQKLAVKILSGRFLGFTFHLARAAFIRELHPLEALALQAPP